MGCVPVVEMDARAGTVTLMPAPPPPGAKAATAVCSAAAAAAAAADGGASSAARTFTFDQVYDETATQAEVFQVTAAPIVDSVMEGINGEAKIAKGVRSRSGPRRTPSPSVVSPRTHPPPPSPH